MERIKDIKSSEDLEKLEKKLQDDKKKEKKLISKLSSYCPDEIQKEQYYERYKHGYWH